MINSSTDYLGRVIYIDDPTFSGRCKVKVFGLFDNIEDQYIPWFAPMNSNVFGTSGGGCISVPKMGDIVRVRFSNGDKYSGEYSSIQNIDPDLIEEIKDDYRDTQVLVYDSQNDLIIIYQNLTGLKLYLRGSQILIDADGMIQAKHKNCTNVIEIKDDVINISTVESDGNNSGTINISAGSTVNVTAPTVNVKGDKVTLGTNPVYRAVKGEKLTAVLQQMAAEIMTKYPQYGSALMGKNFEEILTDKIKVT